MADVKNVYKPIISVVKAAKPAVIIPIVAEGIHLITGGAVDRQLCYQVGTGAYAIYVGLSNWWKNRNKTEPTK